MCLTVWWRTITLTHTPQCAHLGTYLENKYLENEDPENEDPENEDPENEDPENEDPENEDPENKDLEKYPGKPYEKGEWHAMIGCSAKLQDLCANLDEVKEDKNEDEDWWTNNFNDVDALDEFLSKQEVFKK
jgi:hypothetical protein